MNTFEGHQHYVMQVIFNPKDPNTFATASLDRTVKIWSLGNSHCNYTLDGHEKGVNSVSFYQGGDRPYIASASDDQDIRIWDYQSKACVRVLRGHTLNVSSVCFHPRLPFLLSASEDGTVRVWGVNTLRAELIINAGLDRLWALSVAVEQQGEIGIAGDLGSSVMLLGKGEPAISMDQINGKIVWAVQTNVSSCRVSELTADCKLDKALLSKNMGQSDFVPTSLMFSPNGRFIAVIGDSEYTIFTAVAWRNRAFGRGLEFVWASSHSGNNLFAVRDSPTKISIFEDFQEARSIKSGDIPFERIFGGGPLLVVTGAGYVMFYDWNTAQLVQVIELDAHNVAWNASGNDGCEYVALLGIPKGLFILKYQPTATEEEEEAFQLVANVSPNERIRGGLWIGNVAFVFAGADSGKLSYWVSGDSDQVQLISIAVESLLYPLGYYENRIYFVDKDLQARSWSLSLLFLQYQSLVLQGDMSAATKCIQAASWAADDDDEMSNRLGKFLFEANQFEEAYSMAKDPQLLFSLALKLGKLEDAKTLLQEHYANQRPKWKSLGQAALAEWDLSMAADALSKAGDSCSALLLAGITNQPYVLKDLDDAQPNISFASNYLLKQFDRCFELLMNDKRYPEAAMFAQSHGLDVSRVNEAVSHWKDKLQSTACESKLMISDRLADPFSSPELFSAIPNQSQQQLQSQQPATLSQQRKASVKSVSSQSQMAMDQDDLLSLEVNTTGTGSIRTDDVDEAIQCNGTAGPLPTHIEEDGDEFLPQSFDKLAVLDTVEDKVNESMKDAYSSEDLELEGGWN